MEGLLLRFADGIYTVKQAESLAKIRDADIKEITFVSPPSSPGGKGRLRDRLTFLSQSRSVQDLIDAYYAAGPKAGAEMAELLTDSDPQVRRMAAQAISNWDMWGRAALPRAPSPLDQGACATRIPRFAALFRARWRGWASRRPT